MEPEFCQAPLDDLESRHVLSDPYPFQSETARVRGQRHRGTYKVVNEKFLVNHVLDDLVERRSELGSEVFMTGNGTRLMRMGDGLPARIWTRAGVCYHRARR